ncbi:MAG: hypothetical protein QNJ68_12940 [Microcoleaceae cyanobacterium MO_207.B10]|nr:hypothetical protein [Microcoleaceae cyanobacterium MO_207.B10]
MANNELSPAQLELAVANAMSLSLLYTLGRQYLDVPIEKGKYIRPTAPVTRTFEELEDVEFLRLEQVGSSNASLSDEPLIALQTALASCHLPKHCTLIFIVGSDGSKNHIYLGIRHHDPTDYQTRDFVKNLGNFLEGNWSGTRLVPCYPQNQEFQTHVLKPLKNKLHYVKALTGIPSLKPGEKPGYPQSLDRLISGLQGSPFMYMVVAEPMEQGEVNGIIYHLRELMGKVHSLTKITFNETFTETISNAIGKTETWGESITHGINRSETKTNQNAKKVLMGIVLGSLAIGPFFPPALLMSSLIEGGPLLAQLLGLVSTSSLLLEDFFPPSQTTSGRSMSLTESISKAFSQTTTQGQSIAQAFGREYINAHAKAAETLLERYLNRFEQSLTLGSWNVGVYLLAEEPNVTQQGGIQLKALLSGEQSFFEPIRIHDLRGKGEQWGHAVRGALQEFYQPNLTLAIPNNQTALKHPLGNAFNNLTTPLNIAVFINIDYSNSSE